MRRECFRCYYGKHCLNTITMKVPCKLKCEEVLNEEAKDCEEFAPRIHLDNRAIEVIALYNVHYKCPYCGHKDTFYNVNKQGEEIIKCEECGKKYSISWVKG